MKKLDVLKLIVLGLVFVNSHSFGKSNNIEKENSLQPMESKGIHKYFKYLPDTQKDLVNEYIKELAERSFEAEEIYLDIEKLENYYQRDDATRTSR